MKSFKKTIALLLSLLMMLFAMQAPLTAFAALSYQAISGYAEPDNLTVQTSGEGSSPKTKPWTAETIDGESVLKAFNDGSGTVFTSVLVTAKKAGILSLDYKINCNSASYVGLYYGKYDSSKPPTSINNLRATASNLNSNVVDDKFKGTQDWTNLQLEVSEGDQYYFLFYMTAKNTSYYCYLRNINLVSGSQAVSVVSNDTALGTVSTTGITDGMAELGSTVTLTATATGSEFQGWYELDENGKRTTLLSTSNPYSYKVKKNINIQGYFRKTSLSDTGAFKVGNLRYDDLDEAIQKAGSSGTVILVANATIKGNYTLPSGVTFLLPYSDSDTSVKSASDKQPYANVKANGTTQSAITAPGTSVNHTLNMVGATINVKSGGKLVVGGTYSGDRPVGGATVGAHSEIKLDANSAININGGILSNFGYITGAGIVNAANNASVYVPYVVTDFHGGSYTTLSYMVSPKTAPFNSYAFVNIQTTFQIDYTSSLYGYCALYANSSQNLTNAKIISSSSAMLNLTSGYAVCKYETTKTLSGYPNVGRNVVEIYGNASAGSLSMTLSVGISVTVDTKEVDLPVPYNIHINQKSGTLSVPNAYHLLSGSKLTIDEGAALIVANGGSLTIMDGFEAGNYEKTSYPLHNILSNAGMDERAHLIVNGKMTVASGGTFAGIVENNGKGTVSVNTNATLTKTVYDGVLKSDTYTILIIKKVEASKANRTVHTVTARYLDYNSGALASIAKGGTYYAWPVKTASITSFAYNKYDDSGKATATTVNYTTAETVTGSWGTTEYTAPVTVTFKDVNGTVIKTVELTKGSVLASSDIPSLPATKSNNNGTHTTYAWSGNVNAAVNTDTTFTVIATNSPCSYNDVVTAATPNTKGYTTHTCTDCGYFFKDSETAYASDDSTLAEAKSLAQKYAEEDYTPVSYQALRSAASAAVKAGTNSQNDIDAATTAILTAISDLIPYLNVDVTISNGSYAINLEGAEDRYTATFGTTVSLTASANDGYTFYAWFETVSKRFLSYNADYSFKLTTNISLKPIFIKNGSASLIFENDSGYVKAIVTRTTAQWARMTSIEALLPELPYNYAKPAVSWNYNDEEVLSKLVNGEDVIITPNYAQAPGVTLPEIPVAVDGVPAINMIYSFDAENNVGSYVTALSVPNGVTVESIGIAYYYEQADTYSLADFFLTNNNKLTTSKFTYSEDDTYYTCNVKFAKWQYNNWAARAYVTYYDKNGKLRTAYSNQINVFNGTLYR